jgi:hypothetical protein
MLISDAKKKSAGRQPTGKIQVGQNVPVTVNLPSFKKVNCQRDVTGR